MASGASLIQFSPLGAELPASNYPQFDVRNNHVVLDFDPATDETCYFSGVLPRHYAGGGITVDLDVAATSATTGTSRWEVAFERVTGQDTDADSFATAKSVGIAANGTSGVPTRGSIAFTNGAELDSLAIGEAFRILVRRDADGTTGTDDQTGDSELLGVHLRET